MLKFTPEDAVQSPFGDPKNIPFTDDDLVIITDYQVAAIILLNLFILNVQYFSFSRRTIMRRIMMMSKRTRTTLN